MLPACLLALALVDEPPPRFDADGLPLPAEAVRRLGSQRFLVNSLKAAAFSPDGRTVYTLTHPDLAADRKRWVGPGLTAWDAATGRAKWRALTDTNLFQLAVDPNGNTVWVTAGTGPWDKSEVVRFGLSAADGHEVFRAVLRPRTVAVHALHSSGAVAWVSRDSQDSYTLRVTTAGGKNTVERFIGLTRVSQLVWNGAGDRVFFPVSTPDGKQRELWAMDAKTGDIVWSVEGSAAYLLMSPNDAVLAETTGRVLPAKPGKQPTEGEFIVRGRAPRTGREVGAAVWPQRIYKSYCYVGEPRWDGDGRPLLFHPDGKTLVARTRFGEPAAIDLTTWKPLAAPPVIPLGSTFSPDGKTALVTRGRNAVLCDTATGKPIDPPSPGFAAGPVNWPELRFSSSGEYLVRATRMGEGVGEVTVWNAATGVARRRSAWDGLVYWLPREKDCWKRKHWDDEPAEVADTRPANRSTAYWPGGQLRAFWSPEGIHVQDAKTGEVVHTFREQTRPVRALAFSPEGRLLAAESEDGPILLWAVPPRSR